MSTRPSVRYFIERCCDCVGRLLVELGDKPESRAGEELLGRVTKLSMNFEEILLCAHGNFEGEGEKKVF
jgi:hypothetical protein